MMLGGQRSKLFDCAGFQLWDEADLAELGALIFTADSLKKKEISVDAKISQCITQILISLLDRK